MGVLSDINRLVKQAQAPGFVPTPLYISPLLPKGMRERVQRDWAPGGELDSSFNLAQTRVVRGMAKEVKNAIPGFIDSVGGLLGAGKFTKEYISDPIRKAEMAIGGNAIKKLYDGADSYHRGNIEKAIGPTHDANGVPTKKYKDYVEGLNMVDSMSDVVSYGTGLAITWPMWGKAIGAGVKGLGVAGRRVSPLIKADPARFGAAAEKWGPWIVIGAQEAPTVNRTVGAGIDAFLAKSNAEFADRELKEEIGKMSPDMAKRLRSYVMDNYDADLAGSAGISDDEYRKQFVGRIANKFRVLNAPEAYRPGLMKQYGFDDAGMAKFKNRFDAMSSILNAPEDNRAELMRRNGLYDDEIGLMLDAIDSM